MNIKVLAVDDNPGFLTATVKFLELHGYTARGACDGKSAIAEAQAFSPDVVLLDVGLPDMDGYEVVDELRAGASVVQPSFIAVSGRDDADTWRRIEAMGFATLLVKPVSLDTLVDTVARVCGDG